MPVIALSPIWDDEKNRLCMSTDYVSAVLHAGAAPIILPYTDNEKALCEALDAADAVIVTGGCDVDPATYGEEKLACCGSISPLRDRIDSIIIRHALKKRMPILGICRGMQIINVYLGGTLYQDIAEQFGDTLKHPCYDIPREPAHDMKIVPNTLLRGVLNTDEATVNSRHHQAVKTLGNGLHATAYAPDGLIEAMEFDEPYPMLCVQWHPESLEDRFETHRRFFSWLVKEASK